MEVAPPSLVLSERDYFSMPSDWATARLRKLFTGRKSVLLVGLSLADPRLRWLLLERLDRLRAKQPLPVVYAFLSRSSSREEGETIERLARTFARNHEEKFWKSWNLRAVFIDSHELVPYYLRQIRLGPSTADWAKAGEQYLKKCSPRFRSLYDPEIQAAIFFLLKQLVGFLRRRFSIDVEEYLHLGAFVPQGSGNIQLGFRYRGEMLEATEAKFASAQRRLSVADRSRPQGAAGRAYLRGTTVEGDRSNPHIDANFTGEMRREWQRESTFSSILCVPVYDSPQWVPVGVMYLTSNRRVPFWKGLDARDYDDLQTIVRAAFGRALELPA